MVSDENDGSQGASGQRLDGLTPKPEDVAGGVVLATGQTGPARTNTDTKERILREAAKLFAANGYEATGVAELGRTIGLGRGALYHHIESKESLLYEISARHVSQMLAFGEEVLERAIGPEEKFRLLSRCLMRTIAENLPELTVFFADYRSLSGPRADDLHRMRARFETIWAVILAEGQETGVFRPMDPLIVKGILGLHNYSYIWLRPTGRLTPDEIGDLFCDLILAGIKTSEHERDATAS